MGYDTEVAMIKEAKKLGLLTTPYCFNPDEARRMAEVGADVIVGEYITHIIRMSFVDRNIYLPTIAHMGLTTKGCKY